MRNLLLLLSAFTFLAVIPLSANHHLQAQSLWQKRKQHRVRPYQDLKARKVGDLLTVLVRVSTDVNNREQRAMDKATTADADGDAGFSGAAGAGSLQANNQTSSNRTFSGNSAFTSARNFTDRFTVVVVDVLPNGSLVVAGKRKVKIQNDQRDLIMSGVIRGQDINNDNSVSSTLVANLELKYLGTGPEKKYTRQGWLHKKMTDLWPF